LTTAEVLLSHVSERSVLHGPVKKTQKTPADDLALAWARKAELTKEG